MQQTRQCSRFFLKYILVFFFFSPFSRIQSRDAPETKIGTIFLACPRSTQVHVQGLFEIRRCDIIYKCVKAICSDLVYFFFFSMLITSKKPSLRRTVSVCEDFFINIFWHFFFFLIFAICQTQSNNEDYYDFTWKMVAYDVI